MIIFSERINGMYRDVRSAIPERNKQVIHELLEQQLAGGADIIDINLGPSKGDTGCPAGEGSPARYEAGDQFLHGGGNLHGEADPDRCPARDKHHRPYHGPGRRAGQRREAG